MDRIADDGSVSGSGQRRRWLKPVAIGCAAAVVAIVVFVVGTVVVVRAATSGPEKVVKNFLAAAAAGDLDAAYAHFSAPLKQVQPLEQFKAAATQNSMFFDVVDTTFTNRSVDTSGAELSGTVTLRAGTKVPASFKLVKENGDWKLIAYHIGSGGE